ARPSLDPAFSSWDFLLDGDGNKQLLGAGGFGQVYKAFTDKRQTVAVKIVRLEGASSARLMDEAIEKENAEISVLKAIRHPNIVQFLKSERIKKGKLCIFTELISGHSLSELMQLQRRPFDEEAVRDFSKQLPAGTSALLRDFYGRCVQREPRRRAATAELLEHKFL
uniref:Protein kinase domain-containing protein n=1 Tax=Macrostomum lignano TaxID=282301 RepID=A0A1I8I008_9PLAT